MNRREFLKASAAAAAAASCPAMLAAMELELGGKDFHQIRNFLPRERKPFLGTLGPYFDGGFTFAADGDIKKNRGQSRSHRHPG